MKCFIAIVILLFTHKCYAQLSIDYEFYDSNDKEIFYYEDFADSITDENWVHDDTAIYVKEGRYTFYNHYVNDYACRLIDLPIEDKNDFEIEMRVLLPCKCPNEGVIIWGGSCGTDISNKWFIDNTPHSFTYIYDSGNNKSNNGYCRIDTKKYSFNIYTIRKVQDHYFLYVNGKYAFKTQFTPLLGTMFGFGTSTSSHLHRIFSGYSVLISCPSILPYTPRKGFIFLSMAATSSVPKSPACHISSHVLRWFSIASSI